MAASSMIDRDGDSNEPRSWKMANGTAVDA